MGSWVKNTTVTEEESTRKHPESLSSDDVMELLELLEKKGLISSQERIHIVEKHKNHGRYTI